MEGEEGDAQVGRTFEVGEEVGEEEVGVGVAVVGLLGVGFAIAIAILRIWVGRWSRLAVVENDDFVDAEDGKGAGNLAGEGALEVVGQGAGGGIS